MWRPALSALAVIAYAVFSHWSMVHAAGSPWAIALLLGPLLVTAGAYAAARRQWAMLVAMGAGLAAVVLLAWRGGVAEVNRLYVLQHVGIHAALGSVFALSLRGGAVPMITGVALRVHGAHMPEAMHRYTRHVTQLWAGYFFFMLALSVLLYATASWDVWSLFANVGTPLAVAAVMVAEWRVRYWLHPEFERVSIATAMRAFRSRPAPAGAPAP
jgi:uncharacterized membrane protein